MYNEIILDEIRLFAESRDDIIALVLTGSWARGEATKWSDIDLFLITETNPETVLHTISVIMAAEIKEIVKSKPDKWIFFFGDGYLKADISVVSDVIDVEKMYRGSRITNTSRSVLVDKNGTIQKAVSAWIHPAKTPDLTPEIVKATEAFMEMFELASRYSTQNDAYRFYFTYNIALARYSTLLQLQKGSDAYLYTPRSLIEEMDDGRHKEFLSLSGSLDIKDSVRLLKMLSAVFVREYCEIYSRQIYLPREPEEITQFIATIRRRDSR